MSLSYIFVTEKKLLDLKNLKENKCIQKRLQSYLEIFFCKSGDRQ